MFLILITFNFQALDEGVGQIIRKLQSEGITRLIHVLTCYSEKSQLNVESDTQNILQTKFSDIALSLVFLLEMLKTIMLITQDYLRALPEQRHHIHHR